MEKERVEKLFEIYAAECSKGLPWYPGTKEEANNYVMRIYGATIDELLEIGIDPFM